MANILATQFRLLALLAAALLATGCAITPGFNVSTGSNQLGSTERIDGQTKVRLLKRGATDRFRGVRIVTLNAQSLATLDDAGPRASKADSLAPVRLNAHLDYVVGPGDVLSVVVWGHPELTNPAGEGADPALLGRLVAADGTMFYPYVGTFRAAGLRLTELRDYLTSGLRSYIRDPQVDVRVSEYRSKRVHVSGEVNSPGVVALGDTSKGVVDAVGERGGLSAEASRRHVVLTRDGRSYELDTSPGSTSANPELQPGDRIHVPHRSTERVFLLGELVQNGAIPFPSGRFTLIDALAQGEGVDQDRGKEGVLVFRRPDRSDGLATIYRLDLSDAVGFLIAGEFELRASDVVYVGTHAFARYNSIINQLLPTVSTVFLIDRLTE